MPDLSEIGPAQPLSTVESSKRNLQKTLRPRVYEKILVYNDRMMDGVISPILRLKINRSLCNMKCEHCCEEPYMTRDLKKRTGKEDPRPQMGLEDYRRLSEQADQYGLFRFVLTGGEALLDKNLGDLVKALDPYKHLIVLDTNGYYFDLEKAKWFASIGGYKAQISLDSFFAEEHDKFRNTKGAHDRALKALDAAKESGLELLLSTCLVKGRIFTEEFKLLIDYCESKAIPLYVSLAKPVGSARGHDEWVCDKADVDALKDLEAKHNIFTHMTPSYGQPGKCITVKGINTVNHDGEIMPCPYMDMSIGNIMHESLDIIFERGMLNKWLGPYRDECIIGENWDFIKWHNTVVSNHLENSPYLPVPYEQSFALTESF